VTLNKTFKNITGLVNDLKLEVLEDDRRFENAVKER